MNELVEVSNPNTLLNKKLIYEIKNDLITNPNFTNIIIYLNSEKIEQYHINCKYLNFNLNFIFPKNYPFKPPIIFNNNFKIDIEWGMTLRIFIMVSEIIDKMIDKYTHKRIFVPGLGGFLNDRTNRSFKSGDLHDNGHLYNCANFDTHKYQFGSGFIYSILNQYFNAYHYSISRDMLNIFVDNLIDYALIKEIGCVYLVLKIYEEQILSPIEDYFTEITKYLISNDQKQQFNHMKSEFKRTNSIIMENLVERLNSLNHILTIYINIWLYTNFRLDNNEIALHDISFDLHGIIDTFLQTESNTDLYEWSMQFIGKDKSIAQFNEQLFLDNYDYVLNNFRNNSPVLIRFITEFLVIIKTFNNFSNDMLDQSHKIDYLSESNRLSEYKQINPTATTFPSSLIRMENIETTICANLQRILGHNVSLLLPGCFCE